MPGPPTSGPPMSAPPASGQRAAPYDGVSYQAGSPEAASYQAPVPDEQAARQAPPEAAPVPPGYDLPHRGPSGVPVAEPERAGMQWTVPSAAAWERGGHAPDPRAVPPGQAGPEEPTGLQPAIPSPAPPVPEGPRLDAGAVLAAVRDVPGLRSADLHTDESGGRTLRLDVGAGSDPAQVKVAANRALRSRLGVDAQLAVVTGPSEAFAVRTPPRTGEHAVADEAEVRPLVVAEDVAPATREPRAVIERVQVATAGAECAVEVCLSSGGTTAVGRAGGPALDTYLLRVAALAAADAVDVLAAGRARCAIEHVDMVTAGPVQVILVVLVLMAGESAERLVGSAVVAGDARQCAVRATMSALNRRLTPILAG